MGENENNKQFDGDAAIEAKRANLLNAKGDLVVGRREEPVDDQAEVQARRKRAIVGTILCAIILIAVFVVLKVLATDISL